MSSKEKPANYKPAKDREKDLKLALLRIQKGRAKTGETRVTIAAVAREAGVSTALIHNHYPGVAEDIRAAQGRSSRAMRDVKHQDLLAERKSPQFTVRRLRHCGPRSPISRPSTKYYWTRTACSRPR